jgi:putative addiction module CopG family antidote
MESPLEQPANSITVDLGELRAYVESRVRTGAYNSYDEMVQAALEALQREEAAANEWISQLVNGPQQPPKLRTNRGEEIHEIRSFKLRNQDRDF